MFGLAFTLLFGTYTSALAWPTDSQWIPIPKSGTGILDDHIVGGKDGNSDANGGVNIVPYSGDTPAAYTYNDGTYIHFRLRLDARPDQGGGGILAQFGWGVEIDTDQNADDYEWLIMCDGISSPEVVSLQQNTIKAGIGDPSDKAEVTVATWPMSGNHRILLAPTTTNGDADYFLDFRIAYAVFKSATGITDNTMVRYFIGSSRSTNNLTDNGADLLSGTDLYSMATDFITPFGFLPSSMTFYDGTVKFTTDLNGATQRTVGSPGDTLYLRVDDLDLNSSTLPGGKITVTITSPTGDTERVTLTAAGVAGKYTGTLATSASTGSGTNDGTLYVLSDQTITVTYIDAVAANRAQSVPRTATLYMTSTGTDITLSKSVDLPTAGEGALVTFSVVATNLGPLAVTSLTVTDLLPAGLTYASYSGPGSYLPGTGAWTPGVIAVGSSVTLSLRATVNAGTSGSILTNTASLTASSPTDAFAANNSASAQVAVGGTDLRVTKLVDNPLPVAGGSIIYTVRTTNLGPNATGGVVVRDVLPVGVTYVSDTGGGAYNPATGDWAVGTLVSGQATQLNITATVNAGTTGQTITNTASLTASTQPDTDPANNSASVPIQVGFTDLQLTKTARKVTPPAGAAGDSVVANVGNTVEFTVTLRNNGPHAATNVAVTDLVPTGLTYVSHTATQGAYVPASGSWTIGNLTAGATATLTIQVTVNTGTAGQTLINTATVIAVDQPDSNPGNESDDASVAVDGTDLDITKTVTNPTPNPGTAITWIVRVTNNGPNQATGVAVTDILPAGITRTSHLASQGTWSATGGNPTWVWSVGTLNVGANAILLINTTVDTGTTGQTITNTAMITGSNQADPEAANNVASARIAVSGTDLAIIKSVNNPTPNVGETITYTVQVTNNGPNNATGVAVTDLLPPELTYQSHAGGTYTPATGLWNIGNLNNGASTVLTISARVNNGNNGLAITNTASITAATQGDPNLTNNTASAVVNVGSTNLAVTKTVSNATPAVSAPFTYTVTVSNSGANTATGVELEDVLPAAVTQSGYTASQGTFSGGLWLVGTFNAGASASLQITASANAGTAGTTITNTAQLQRLNQADTNAADNLASVDIVPTLAGDLSTSAKTVIDLNGGDVLSGDTLRYTITLIETDGSTASDVRVTDNIPANVDTFTVVSFPAGAANASTGAGTGANGNGFLDITGITVPASSSVTIVFEVRVNGPDGATIANTADISNPGGIGGSAASPTLTIAASSVPGSGTKQLYLQAAVSQNTPATPRFLKRTPITSILVPERVRIRRTDPAVAWNLTPALQTDLTLNPDFSVVLLMTDEDAANLRDLELTLSYDAGGGPVTIAQQNFTNLNIADFLPTPYTFNLTSAAATLPSGSLVTLSVRNSTPGATALPVYIYPYFNANTSRVELDSATVINVDSIGFFSDVAYPGGAPLAGAGPGDTVRIRSTISDPFGSYDITSATVTITDPLGVVTVNQAAMTQVFDSAAATKVYEYRYTIPGGGPTGNWDVRVDALEGTEGLVSDYGLTALSVANLPALTFMKSSRTLEDPVNGTTNPKAIPGADIAYTLKITNFGSGAAERLVFTDAVPANTKLFVGDLGQGSSVFFIDGAVASGFVAADVAVNYSSTADCTNYTYDPLPTADADGYNTEVCTLRVTMNNAKTLPGGNAEFNLEFKVRIE